MMPSRSGPWLAIGGGGIAWTVHLFAGYVLVALGCPRAWPLGSMLAAATVLTAGMSLAIGVMSVRRWRRVPVNVDDDAAALLYGAGAMLAGLFTVAILLGGVAALILPPCRGVAIGG
jgi:hypothetical protein